jgi:hypothetical protein
MDDSAANVQHLIATGIPSPQPVDYSVQEHGGPRVKHHTEKRLRQQLDSAPRRIRWEDAIYDSE